MHVALLTGPMSAHDQDQRAEIRASLARVLHVLTGAAPSEIADPVIVTVQSFNSPNITIDVSWAIVRNIFNLQ